MWSAGDIAVPRLICQRTREAGGVLQHAHDRLASFKAAIVEGADAIESGEDDRELVADCRCPRYFRRSDPDVSRPHLGQDYHRDGRDQGPAVDGCHRVSAAL